MKNNAPVDKYHPDAVHIALETALGDDGASTSLCQMLIDQWTALDRLVLPADDPADVQPLLKATCQSCRGRYLTQLRNSGATSPAPLRKLLQAWRNQAHDDSVICQPCGNEIPHQSGDAAAARHPTCTAAA